MSALRAAARIAGTSIAMGREYGERVINQRMEDTARVLSELCHNLETANGVQFVEILSSPRCGYHRRWPHRRVEADLRSRQLRELKSFSEAVRNIAVFCD